MNDYKMFNDKNLSDVLEDIYTTSVNKRLKIEGYIHKIQELVKDASDAQALVPIIKDLLDVSIRNDEILVKMISAASKGNVSEQTNGSVMMSEEEKRNLLKTLKDVKEEEKQIDKDISNIEKNIG